MGWWIGLWLFVCLLLDLGLLLLLLRVICVLLFAGSGYCWLGV